jgi:hypothetical protein
MTASDNQEADQEVGRLNWRALSCYTPSVTSKITDEARQLRRQAERALRLAGGISDEYAARALKVLAATLSERATSVEQTPAMPIRPHLGGQRFDPETIRVMGLAYEMALVALQLADRADLANELVAHKLIDFAKAGERDPERLCDGVMKEFTKPRLGKGQPRWEPS